MVCLGSPPLPIFGLGQGLGSVSYKYVVCSESYNTKRQALQQQYIIIITPGWVVGRYYQQGSFPKLGRKCLGRNISWTFGKQIQFYPVILLPGLRMGRKGKASHGFPSPHQEERLSEEKRTDSGGGGKKYGRETDTHTHTEQREPVVDFLNEREGSKVDGVGRRVGGRALPSGRIRKKVSAPKGEKVPAFSVQPNPIRSQVPRMFATR